MMRESFYFLKIAAVILDAFHYFCDKIDTLYAR